MTRILKDIGVFDTLLKKTGASSKDFNDTFMFYYGTGNHELVYEVRTQCYSSGRSTNLTI